MPDFLSTEITSTAIGIVVIVVLVAGVTDLRDRKIYNALTFPAIALGIAINTMTHGFAGLGFAAAGFLLGALLFSAPVALLGRGAGDLKLLAAIGALCGPEFVIWTALYAGVAGGAFALIVLLSRRRFGQVLAGMATDVGARSFPIARSNICLPYAIPIAMGALVSLFLV